MDSLARILALRSMNLKAKSLSSDQAFHQLGDESRDLLQYDLDEAL
jgi:hypothetical protein